MDKKGLLWQLKDISLYGTKNKLRLNNVNLEIHEGVTAIVGPSGAGKTSLLNILSQYEKESSGTITETELAKKKFWIPSNFGLWGDMTVTQHLAIMRPHKTDQELNQMLAKFAIEGKATNYPDELSQGEKSRLAAARALFAKPSVILMDEPLINIAPAKQLFFWDKLIDIAKEENISLLYATHSPNYILGSTDTIICIDQGEIEYIGAPEKLYYTPTTKKLAEYLGVINWFNKNDSIFLENKEYDNLPFGIRPSELNLIKKENSKLKVIKSTFRGDFTETLIKDTNSGQEKLLLSVQKNNLKKNDYIDMIFTKSE